MSTVIDCLNFELEKYEFGENCYVCKNRIGSPYTGQPDANCANNISEEMLSSDFDSSEYKANTHLDQRKKCGFCGKPEPKHSNDCPEATEILEQK